MTETGDLNLLMRRLDVRDKNRLGGFFERNNRIEVTRFFHPFPMTRAIAFELLNPLRQDLFFGLEENDRLIGFSMLRGWDEGFVIPNLGVVVDFSNQGKGLGRRLTEWTLRWADQNGCAKVRLSVYEENQAAYKLYTSLDFVEASRSIHSSGFVQLVMERRCPATPLPVYISTQCLAADEPLRDRLKRFYAAGLHHVELSNHHLKNNEEFQSCAKTFPGQLMLHHFFPPTAENFVLNLASANDTIRSETLAFFMRGVDWSAACNAKFYTIHAGYITDPVGRDEYGFVFLSATEAEKSHALKQYANDLIPLAQYAKKRGLTLLVENNVLAKHHRGKLLLSTPHEFQELYARWPDNIPLGILLDWGHWEITAHTLQKDLGDFVHLKKLVMGLHLHSNNKLADQHHPFKNEPNTLKMLKAFKPAFITIEGRYKNLSELQTAALEIEKECAWNMML